MAAEEIPYEDLIKARDALNGLLRKNLTDNERTFLVSLQSGEPDWGVMGIAGIEKLPAIQWKLTNISKKGCRVTGGTQKNTRLVGTEKRVSVLYPSVLFRPEPMARTGKTGRAHGNGPLGLRSERC